MIFDRKRAEKLLGQDVMSFIEQIAMIAQDNDLSLYLVGGIVRDLLLNRPNYDIDFVLEANAIDFSTKLQAKFGGEVKPYPPFKTATWFLDDIARSAMNISQDNMPNYIDFVSARSEVYEHPAALPTVTMNDIQHDLYRRDFTINTLALQLSPKSQMWQLLDLYNGVDDLNQQVIRILHDLSFEDDPTRLFRAVRFSERLEFGIDPHTATLMQKALPMLQHVTGERIQNEINLIFKESEPIKSLLTLERIGILQAIHPDFCLPEQSDEIFAQLMSNTYPQWDVDRLDLSWHLILGQLAPDRVSAIADRLLIGQHKKNAIVTTANLMLNADILHKPTSKPSDIVAYLDKVSVTSLVTLWLYHDNALIRERIELYYEKWQYIKPIANGNTLKMMGLKPSPLFRDILHRLKIAWLDGLIYNEAQEQAFLAEIIQEVTDGRTD